MKVKYVGQYRENSLCYKGVMFTEDEYTDVEPEWYERHKSAKLKQYKARKASKADDATTDH